MLAISAWNAVGLVNMVAAGECFSCLKRYVIDDVNSESVTTTSGSLKVR